MIRWTLRDGTYELELGRDPCNEIGTTVLGELERFLDEVDTENASARPGSAKRSPIGDSAACAACDFSLVQSMSASFILPNGQLRS